MDTLSTLWTDALSFIRGTQHIAAKSLPAAVQFNRYNAFILSIHRAQSNQYIPSSLTALLAAFNYLYSPHADDAAGSTYDVLTTDTIARVLTQRSDLAYDDMIHRLYMSDVTGCTVILRWFAQLFATYKVSNMHACVYVKLRGLYRTHIVDVNYNRLTVRKQLLTAINDKNTVLVYHTNTQYYVIVGMETVRNDGDDANKQLLPMVTPVNASDLEVEPVSDTEDYDADERDKLQPATQGSQRGLAADTHVDGKLDDLDADEVNEKHGMFDEPGTESTVAVKPVAIASKPVAAVNTDVEPDYDSDVTILMIQQLDTNNISSDSTDTDSSSDTESDSEVVVGRPTKPNIQYSVVGLKLSDIMDELEQSANVNSSCILKFSKR